MAITFDTNYQAVEYDITCPNVCGRMVQLPSDPREFRCPKCAALVMVPPEPEKPKKPPEGWLQSRFCGKPPLNQFHLNGPKPRPSNENCTVSKVVGQPCPSCRCPAFYVEVETVLAHWPNGAVSGQGPRVNRIICANCRKRTHEQQGGKLLRVYPAVREMSLGDRSSWTPAWKGEKERVELVRMQHISGIDATCIAKKAQYLGF